MRIPQLDGLCQQFFNGF